MIYILKTITFISLQIFINSCTNKCVVADIEVSELLSTVAKDQ